MLPQLLDKVKSDPHIVLYGAASAGMRAYYNLLGLFVDPENISFFDSNPSKQGRAFLGRPVLTRSEFGALDRGVLILVSSGEFLEIMPILREQGFTNYHYVHELIFSRKRFWKFDSKFLSIVEKITYRAMSDDEFYTLYHSMSALRDVPGAIAEVGVYKGGSAFLLACVSGGRALYLFDTFKGLPVAAANSHAGLTGREPGPGWFDIDAGSVREFVLHSGILPEKLHLRVGYFPDTARDLVDERFSLVHLDASLYQTTIDALNFFYPRLSKGGRIITHDYNAIGCPGVRKAFDEYFGGKNLSHLIVEISESQAMALRC